MAFARRLSFRAGCALALASAIVAACSDDGASSLTDSPPAASPPPAGASGAGDGAALPHLGDGGDTPGDDATSPPSDARPPSEAGDSGSDATPGDGGLPAKILGIYFFMYNSPRLATIQAEAPQYNVVYYAFALGTNNGGNVSVSVPAQAGGEQSFKTDVAAWKASGRTAILSVGGGSNNGLNLQGSAQAAQFLSTITPAIDAYGFQGIDWDLETGGSTYDVATVVSISRQLKAKYGPAFVISLVPRPYEFRSGGSELYRSIATQLGNDCDLIGFQFYDYPESNNASQQAGIIHDDITDAVKAVPARKLLIGAEAPNAGLAWSPSSVYRDAYKTMNGATGGLRGAFVWDSPNEQASGWDFAKTVGPAVLGP